MSKYMGIESGSSIEHKDKPVWRVWIHVQRHGEKEGDSGGLSERGAEEAREYYREAYKGTSAGVVWEVESSPIDRAEQTAQLYVEAKGELGGSAEFLGTDERLSEGTVSRHSDIQAEHLGGKGGRWMRGFMDLNERLPEAPDMKIGKEVASEFAQWLLEKINAGVGDHQSKNISAFSHGTVMAAFILSLQERFGMDILPVDWKEKNIFRTMLPYLSYVNFDIDSLHPESVDMYFLEKKYSIPKRVIEKIATTAD
jgi:broad specificity phosphatase PhoE